MELLVPLLVLPLIFVCPVVGVWGLGKTLLGLVQRRRARAVRGLAMVFGALGVGMYALGVLAVGAAAGEAEHGTNSSPAPACRPMDHGTVTGHRTGFLPPRFDCVLEDGTTYSAGVLAGWFTPVALVLTATGVGLAVAERRASPDRLPEPAR